MQFNFIRKSLEKDSAERLICSIMRANIGVEQGDIYIIGKPEKKLAQWTCEMKSNETLQEYYLRSKEKALEYIRQYSSTDGLPISFTLVFTDNPDLIFPRDITTHIRKFRNYLNISWSSLESLMFDHNWDDDVSFLSDWMQMNWEFLVERELLENKGFLTSFAPAFSWSRVTFPQQSPTFTVIAKSNKLMLDIRTSTPIPQDQPLRLYCLSTLNNVCPPFDLADLVIDSTKKAYKVPVNDLDFFIVPISEVFAAP